MQKNVREAIDPGLKTGNYLPSILALRKAIETKFALSDQLFGVKREAPPASTAPQAGGAIPVIAIFA